MLYTRIILNDTNVDDALEKLGARMLHEFAFYDLIYMNNNGASITDDTLKIRVYKHNEWENKNVLVIRKKAEVIKGVKEDKVLIREEFDSEEDALKYVHDNLSDEFSYKFRLEKSGIEYECDDLRIWVEDIKTLGLSIEFGSSNNERIEDVIKLFNVKERLEVSVPEYLYKRWEEKF